MAFYRRQLLPIDKEEVFAKNLVRLAPDDLHLQILEIGDVRICNEFKAYVGVLIVTPEYDYAVPEVLKNCLRRSAAVAVAANHRS